MLISCQDKYGNECSLRPPSNTRRSLFALQNATHNESEKPKINGTDEINNSFGKQNASTLPRDIDPTVPYCEDKEFTFKYNISFSNSANENVASAKEIVHFVKARNGVQKDLYSDIATVFLSLGSTLVLDSTESLNICSNMRAYKSLITLDLQNVEFDEAFDVFSEDLTIDDATDERQCENIRSYLGFERDNIDDYEVCRTFEDIKCDYSQGKGDESVELLQNRPKGGKIPDFEGFEFKEQTFAGLQFEGNEFEGFEFEGFDPSGQLTFQEVTDIRLERADSREYKTYEVDLSYVFHERDWYVRY